MPRLPMKKLQRKFRSLLRGHHKHDDDGSDALGAGAVVPEELFPRILYWVSRDDRRDEVYRRLNREISSGPRNAKHVEAAYERLDEEVEKAGPRYTLVSLSLVCRYWANQCRKYMFGGATLNITTLHNAQLFRKYSLEGCPELTTVCSLISHVSVRMDFREFRIQRRLATSLLHIIYFPQVKDKLRDLAVFGPMPPDLPPCKIDSPHWALSNLAVPPPTATSYAIVSIHDIAFPSFRHAIKYLSYFQDASHIKLFELTWEDKPLGHLRHSIKPLVRYRERLDVTAQRCTNDLWLCLQVAMLYPDFPLRSVPSSDQYWAIYTMGMVRDFFNKAPKPKEQTDELRFTLYSHWTRRSQQYGFQLQIIHRLPNFARVNLLFMVDSTPKSTSQRAAAGRNSPAPPQLVGLVIYVSKPHHSEATSDSIVSSLDLSLLRKHVERRQSLRFVVFAFQNYSILRAFVQKYKSICEPPPSKRMFVMVCDRSEEHPFRELPLLPGMSSWRPSNPVGIDPTSLEASGEQWSGIWDIMVSLSETYPRSPSASPPRR